ncbi:hypothetical protein [[Eubacterium] cellulosolvens]
MKIKSLPELMSEIKKEYDKDPYNWRYLRGRDSNNHISTFISHDDKKLWQVLSEWKNPVTPLGIGKLVKRKLDDEIQDLMKTGTNIPIHEVYPSDEKFLIALGLGKYSESSTEKVKELLTQDIQGYCTKVEKELNLELKRLLHKEQIFNHYL